MLDIYTVSFFGHRFIENGFEMEKILEEYIKNLIDQNDYVEFIVGRNGDFDRIVSSLIHRTQKNYRDDNSTLTLLLPYMTHEYLNNQDYFDDFYGCVEISLAASVSHPKSAIGIRNREMVDRSNLIIMIIECRNAKKCFDKPIKSALPKLNLHKFNFAYIHCNGHRQIFFENL